MTFVDACAGFNQIVNTERARKMLAIVARSGQFLPRCLTFGPTNGPEDFSYVVDRIYAPGRRGKRRFCKEWMAYADDLTIRTGRCVDGTFFTDAEYEERIKQAAQSVKETGFQPAAEALEGFGFLPAGLGSEVQDRKGRRVPAKVRKFDRVECNQNNPFAHAARGINCLIVIAYICPTIVMSSVVKEQYNHKADIEETDRIQQISDSHNPRTLLRLAQASNCLRNTTSWCGPCAPATTAHARGEGGRDCDPYPAPRPAMSRS